MSTGHEDTVAELHAETQAHRHSKKVQDMAGADIEKEYSSKSDGQLSDVELGETADGQEPNEHEKATLRRIGESLPASTYLIAVVELCERFTFYGCQGLFQNYVSHALDGTDGAPGLSLGHQAATGLNTFFSLFCYVTPILGAIVSDQYLGKYKTIVVFACVYWLGLIILWATSLPASLDHGAGTGGFIAAIIVIGFGTGGIKANIAPLIADQYQRAGMAVKTIEKSGERVIIDPAIAYQRIYMIFYGCINVGSLSLLATPFMERDIGFWSAYVLAFCMFCIGLVILILRRHSYVVHPPHGTIITDSFKAVGMMIRGRSMDAAKPTYRRINGLSEPKWDDHFVDLLKRTLVACKIFAFYPIFWICYQQFSTNFVSQAAQMAGHGMPNDEMQNFDPIAILVFLPILDRLVYPLLRKWRIPLRPITRITIGFVLAGLSLAYAAIVQHLIYSAGPCYGHPNAEYCADLVDNVYQGNNVHIAIQTPAYVFIGLSEIFLNVTGLEYAYTKAPPQMKSFVQALYLLTSAIGSAVCEALVPAAYDPAILWMYVGVSCVAGVTAVIFWTLFHDLDAKEDEINALDNGDKQARANGQEL